MDSPDVDADLERAPDDALVVAFANGDVAAGRVLLGRLTPRLFAHASRILGGRFEAEAQVSTWAFRVVINLCTDRLRLRTRRPQVGIDAIAEPEAPHATAVERMTDADRTAALDRALAALPDRQRQAVVLRHLDGLSNPEIAAIMELGVEAVESLTARGKRALATALAGRKEELGYSDG